MATGVKRLLFTAWGDASTNILAPLVDVVDTTGAAFPNWPKTVKSRSTGLVPEDADIDDDSFSGVRLSTGCSPLELTCVIQH